MTDLLHDQFQSSERLPLGGECDNRMRMTCAVERRGNALISEAFPLSWVRSRFWDGVCARPQTQQDQIQRVTYRKRATSTRGQHCGFISTVWAAIIMCLLYLLMLGLSSNNTSPIILIIMQVNNTNTSDSIQMCVCFMYNVTCLGLFLRVCKGDVNSVTLWKNVYIRSPKLWIAF